MPSVSRGGSHDITTAKFSTLIVKFLGGPGTMYVKNQNHTWSNYISNIHFHKCRIFLGQKFQIP